MRSKGAAGLLKSLTAFSGAPLWGRALSHLVGIRNETFQAPMTRVGRKPARSGLGPLEDCTRASLLTAYILINVPFRCSNCVAL